MYGISIKKGRKKFTDDVYFNKSKREKLKEDFLRIQKSVLEGPDFSEKPVLKNEFEEREFKTSMLNLSVVGLDFIKNAEEFDKDTLFINCKFELYKKNNSYVFKTTFFKPLKNENKTSFLVFENGLPEISKKKGYIEKVKYDLTGYRVIDRGTFEQKIKMFKEVELFFKGKEPYNFLLKLIDKDKWTYWVIRR